MASGTWLICMAGAYLVGSIPVGFLIGRAHGIDIRQHGSGNIGATNVGRVLGRKLGVLCFVIDLLKGALPVLISGIVMGAITPPHVSREYTTNALLWMGVAGCVMAGHIFPVWLKFKGGKGVATGLGAVLGVAPVLTIPALFAAATWIVAIRRWKFVSLASIIAAASLPVWLALLGLFTTRIGLVGGTYEGSYAVRAAEMFWPYLAVATILAMLVVVKHHSNIKRLRAGTEPRVKWA